MFSVGYYSILVLRLAILILACAMVVAATGTCNQSCGSGKSEKRVNYPFGFSSRCPIKLTCIGDDSRIQLAGFDVLNVTADSIVVNFSANCSRSISTIYKLIGDNYAPTSHNGLLLQNCPTTTSSGCAVPTVLLQYKFSWLSTCSKYSNNLTCFASGGVQGFLSKENISSTGCGLVFSPIFLSAGNSSTDVYWLEFETVHLGWWLQGTCNCSENATCKNFSTPGGGSGYRCRCSDGFTGDGFNEGEGCRPIGCVGHCGHNRKAILIGAILAGASAAPILAIFCYLRRRSTSLNCHTKEKRLLSEAAGNSNIPLYTCKEIERATNGFSEKQRLGTGAYGTVYAGILHNDVCVAIKKIKYRDNESTDQVMNEIKLLSSVSHPNLVRLLGCCEGNGDPILVYEYMHNGTLAQHLQRERGNGLPWTIRLTVAAETADAIAYLHSAMDPPIYHRDIKSSNILLDDNYQSKVADFGLSRFGMTETSHISTAPQGTPGYVDPEYHQNFHLSDKSDVYSFGVVLVEIITALRVVDFRRPQSEVNLAALAIDRIGKGRVDEIIDPFLEPTGDAWTLTSIHKVAELAFRCLSYHGDTRPSMMEVAEELGQIRFSGRAPLEDDICMGSSVASS